MSRYAPDRRVSLLVRNLPLDCRPEDLRAKFERYGEIRDVYMPRDYYTQRPRGFGFVEFRDPRDAEDALYALDRSIVGGREISVVLSKEARKTPREMLRREDTGPRRGRRDERHRSRSPRRRSRSRGRSYSRSPRRSRSYERGTYKEERSRSPVARGPSRSASPKKEIKREGGNTPSPKRANSRSPSRSRSAS